MTIPIPPARPLGLSPEVRAAARSWVVRLADPSATTRERAAFEAWLARDPSHAAAYQNVLRLYSAAGELKDRFSSAPPAARLARRFSPKASAWIGSSAAAMALAVWLAQPASAPPARDFATHVAEVRDVALDDGSMVTLGADTEMEVAFSASERRVRIGDGEAFFEVAPDPQRPFLVDLGPAHVRVVGTAFEMKAVCGGARISVMHGTVEVTTPTGRVQRVTAGHVLELPAAGNGTAALLQSSQAIASWRENFVSYEDASLCEVVADANRYGRTPITLAEPALGVLRVSVAYPTDQVDQMLASLDAGFPIDIRHNADGSIAIVAPR